MKTSILIASAAALTALSISGCATISEDQCLAGNWAERGYTDGARGVSRGRLVDYADTCAKYAVSPDNRAYIDNYEAGLRTYCTYERGFARGKNGDNYNQVCSGELARDFAPGYDEGRVIYEIYKEHKRLINVYEDTHEQLVDVRLRLKNPDLPDDEYKRLNKKKRRLDKRREDLRIDIRAHERVHDLPRYDFR
ncbi:MAG: DUF2799 domain-containing protein [Hyphomonadaceae bacterium]|nr:DUF2799 domain-containing protein [Hyphomonadaceae bacterium]